MTFFEPELFELELLGAEDFFTLELEFDPELDFTLVAEELFEEELVEDPLDAALLFPDERTRVILPSVELVFLDLVTDDVFGIFRSSEVFVFSLLDIFTLRESSGSAIFVDVPLLLESLMKVLLSLSVFNRILLLSAGTAPGCALDILI